MTKVLRIGNRLILVDGYNPLSYINLVTNKLHRYIRVKYIPSESKIKVRVV